jgi:hypothetical protein
MIDSSVSIGFREYSRISPFEKSERLGDAAVRVFGRLLVSFQARRFSIRSLARREKTLHRLHEQTGLIHKRHVPALGKHDEFRPRYQRIHNRRDGGLPERATAWS